MKVAIIPARGGSKRIPRKNIRTFHGKPMLAWSVEAAIHSGCFDRVIVSTDDAEIAEVARHCGADTPFLRPSSLADDHADTTSVIAHAITWLQAQGEPPAMVCCLYATAPFARAEDLRQGLEMLERTGRDYVFSVTSYAFPIQRAIRITPDNGVEMFSPGHADTRSQDLEPAYHDAGQFYWGRAEAWLAGRSVFSPRSAPFILPSYRVQDIDTPEDWERAELMFGELEKSGRL